jgi:hypothetical protein
MATGETPRSLYTDAEYDPSISARLLPSKFWTNMVDGRAEGHRWQAQARVGYSSVIQAACVFCDLYVSRSLYYDTDGRLSSRDVLSIYLIHVLLSPNRTHS